MSITFQIAGKVITEINRAKSDTTDIVFKLSGGEELWMRVDPECSSARLIDIIGNIDDLLNSPIISYCEEVNPTDVPDIICTHSTYKWTVYKFKNHNGSVSFRWLGGEDHYISGDVCFYFHSREENEWRNRLKIPVVSGPYKHEAKP